MADPRFFRAAVPFTVARLAELTGAQIAGAGQRDLLVRDLAPLETAGPTDLSFLSNTRYTAAFGETRAGAAFAHPAAAGHAPSALTLLLTSNPYMAYARAAQAFYPETRPSPSRAATAVVHDTARVSPGAALGHYVVIEAGAEIGEGTRIEASSVIGAGVVIGRECRIGPNVTISHCLMGDRVTVYPGAQIGQDGFGFASDRSGHVRIPQLGRVIIGDDVEIGANTTIDRGAGPDTVIGAGSMIDNLVQIGHNVVLGRGCVIVAQSGISGSTKLGDFVATGGQAALAGHLSIGEGARIGAKSGVMRDVASGQAVGGIPAVPLRQWLRQSVLLERLAKKKGS